MILLFVDQTWWVRRPTQASAFAQRGQPIRYPLRWEQGPDRFVMYASKSCGEEQVFYTEHEKTNSVETTAFLRQLVTVYADKRAVIVIWDNASWHKSQMVNNWRHAHNLQAKRRGGCRLICFRLPNYSPWLNPIEPLFQHLKRWVNALHEWATFRKFKNGIRKTMRTKINLLERNTI